MAAYKDVPLPEDSKGSKLTPTSSTSTMKVAPLFRRGSAMSVGDTRHEKDSQSALPTQAERRSSLTALPMRLRRKKTQPSVQNNDHDVETAERLGALLFSLPSEILAQIVTYLTIRDVYNLRSSARIFNLILDANATLVTRHCLPEIIPETAQACVANILYPIIPPNLSIFHFLRMVRRQNTLDKQIYHILAFVQMKIYMARTGMDARVLSVDENRQRLIEAFQRPGWIIYHFLENYRDIVIYKHPSHRSNLDDTSIRDERSTEKCSSCEQCMSLARDLVATYPSADILPAYHFHQLLLEHLQIAIRAPLGANNLERRLRGWSKAPITEQSLATFFILGGIPEIRKVSMMQGSYGSRISFVNEFMEKVNEAIKVNQILDNSGPPAENKKKSNKSSSKAEAVQRERRTLSSGSIATLPTTPRTNSLAASSTATEDLFMSLSPSFASLTQDCLDSLPDLSTFFYEVWKEKIAELNPSEEDISSPYPWLQQVMTGSGIDFTERSRPYEPTIALGASVI